MFGGFNHNDIDLIKKSNMYLSRKLFGAFWISFTDLCFHSAGLRRFRRILTVPETLACQIVTWVCARSPLCTPAKSFSTGSTEPPADQRAQSPGWISPSCCTSARFLQKKERRKEGRKEGTTEGRKEGRNDGRTEERRKARRKEGMRYQSKHEIK